MSYEDKTVTCVQCGKEFTFTAGEQEFYAQRGFSAPPKRCKTCRDTRRQKPADSGGIYRSPAFEGSAPEHQKIRGRRDGGRPGRGRAGQGGRSDYRSPAFREERRDRDQDYRSPAFREHEHIKPEQEYRSPAFREYDAIKPEEEYRAPGFKEHEDLDLKEEYRAPGFSDLREKYRDEKPTFVLTCSWCGKKESVPFLPEEKEEPLCQECYTAKRKAEQAARAEQSELHRTEAKENVAIDERPPENGERIDPEEQ